MEWLPGKEKGRKTGENYGNIKTKILTKIYLKKKKEQVIILGSYIVHRRPRTAGIQIWLNQIQLWTLAIRQKPWLSSWSGWVMFLCSKEICFHPSTAKASSGSFSTPGRTVSWSYGPGPGSQLPDLATENIVSKTMFRQGTSTKQVQKRNWSQMYWMFASAVKSATSFNAEIYQDEFSLWRNVWISFPGKGRQSIFTLRKHSFSNLESFAFQLHDGKKWHQNLDGKKQRWHVAPAGPTCTHTRPPRSHGIFPWPTQHRNHHGLRKLSWQSNRKWDPGACCEAKLISRCR